MSVAIMRADARSLPLADACVDLVVTSPPYFALRSYTDGGGHYAGQLGSEASPGEFLDALIECTAEMVRVLKPSGSLFVNLGDKYAAGHGGSSTEGKGVNINVGHAAKANFRDRDDLPNAPASWGKRDATGRAIVPGFRPKTLMGMPWRYALRCIDDLGLILRAEIIWSKPNGLPESVTDRVRRSHETWFHLVKSPRYFAAVDEIRERYAPETATRYLSGYTRTGASANGQTANGVMRKDGGGPDAPNPLGKLPGSVWEIPSQPLTVPAALGIDHFAAFPVEWPKRLILGWSPREVCTACGEGRHPVIEAEAVASPVHAAGSIMGSRRSTGDVRGWDGLPRFNMSRTITGYTCACPTPDAPSTPGVVLDPFGGTGTTALAAHALGRHGITVDLSADYCRLAAWRTSDGTEIARVLGLARPPVEANGQCGLFEVTR